MSIKNREVAFRLHCDHGGPEDLTGIQELGFNDRGGFVISAWTTPRVPPGVPRGSYFTSIPISPLEYRRAHATRAEYDRRGARRLVIYDDWGRSHAICAPPDIIDALIAECEANDIARRASPGGAEGGGR